MKGCEMEGREMAVQDLRFKLAGEEDASGVLEIYAPVVRDTAISWEYEVPDLAEMRRRIRDKSDHGYPWILALDSAPTGCDVTAGYAYAGRWRDRQAYDWSCEVSVYVHPEYRRIGLGRALYQTLFRILRAQGFAYAVAGIALPNEPSLMLHRAVGMCCAGTSHGAGFKSGMWRDIAFYEIELGRPCPPPRLIPIRELAGSDDWEGLLRPPLC